MAFDGSGAFSRLYNWVTDAANGIKIRADRMDAEMNGFATGLSDCVTRDGQSPATNDLPMGGFHHTNCSDASDQAHYATAKQVINGALVYLTAGGTANAITLTSAVAPAALAAGQSIVFIAASANTDVVTINRDSLGAKNLYARGVALSSGMIQANDLVVAVYDGTQYNLVAPDRSPVTIASGGTGQSTKAAAFDALSPITTKGDLIGYNGTHNVRLGVGTNGYVLTANSSAAEGFDWEAPSGPNITVSASSPSGGSNGDLWFQTS